MYSYISSELPQLLRTQAPMLDMSRMAVMGHSMGGHGAFNSPALQICMTSLFKPWPLMHACAGALTLGLKNPDMFASISAFAPICNPSNCSWGLKGVYLHVSGACSIVTQHWCASDGSVSHLMKRSMLMKHNTVAHAHAICVQFNFLRCPKPAERVLQGMQRLAGTWEKRARRHGNSTTPLSS